MKYRVILLALAAWIIAFPAQAQYRAVSVCPGATALQPAGSSGAIALVDVNGNLCISGAIAVGPSSAAGAGVTPVTSATLVANQIVKAAPGNLYSFEVSADSTLSAAAWWIMIYNATAAPADGAVTPLKCYALPSGTTSYSAAFPTPIAFSTGITIGVSTTGCFTKTQSVHAFISGDAQ